MPIAIYHCSIKIFSRGKGKSAVAAAAYRAAEKIQNQYDGKTYDYTRKKGVVFSEILLPDHTPAEYADRAVLWNAVEQIEKASNSQLAREIQLALPVELTQEQNISLVREYVNQHFVSVGMCADFAIHDTGEGNPHAHIMLTMRPIEQDGEWGAKSKKEYILDRQGEKIPLKSGEFKSRKISVNDWNEQTKAEEWREAWADSVNAALEKQNLEIRVDHRSYERQGIDQIPTIHLGVAAHQMEQKGIATERGNVNREIRLANLQIQKLQKELRKLKHWAKRESLKSPQSPLADEVEGILTRERQRSRNVDSRAVKSSEQALEFLRENEIQDYAGLMDYCRDLYGELGDVQDAFKPLDRMEKVLTEHIQQANYLKKFQPFYKAYKSLKPRKQPQFYEVHRREIMLYEYAKRYFKEQRIEPEQITPKKWQEALKQIPAQRQPLYHKYSLIKEKVQQADKVRYGIENVLRRERARTRPQSRNRNRGMER